jgi:predicted HAD superfamily Cof-like phosphohydrolase
MITDLIEMWHKRARPTPTKKDFNVQLGCHFEEIAEMMDTIVCSDTAEWVTLKRDVNLMAKRLKAGAVEANIEFRKDFLDSLADQIVTATGAGHCAGMQITEAVRRVNSSNWSKYDTNGKPIFDANGKIVKGPDYEPPNLEGLY